MQNLRLECLDQPPHPQIPKQSTDQNVLGNLLVLDLTQFPELEWISGYLAHLQTLQAECDLISQAIQEITAEGDAYHDYWIEPYTKSKNGKHYTYYQLRWLAGGRKDSGQPKVRTKHLSHQAVGEVRAAIDRGHKVQALEYQRQQVEAEISRLKHRVQGTERRLKRAISQNPVSRPESREAIL